MVDRILPTLLTIYYESLDDEHAALLIQTPSEVSKHFTIVHDGVDGVRSYELSAGKVSPRIPVRDFETLTITVRDEVAVAASGIFEVNTDAASGLDCYCLIPRSVSNLLVTQMLTMQLGEVQRRLDDVLMIVIRHAASRVVSEVLS